ncbi:MAG: NAD-dependent epimerase/dehydratase family protein [bacterium]
MSKIKLIGLTGATGVIGSRLLANLAATHPEVQIRCFARNIPTDRLGENVEWFQGDLMSEADCGEFVHGLDVIGHFAQSNAPAISDRHWPSDLVSNIGATLNLLEALRRRGDHPCHFLFASSGGSVYGQSDPDGGLYSEDDPCSPLSPYGIQKLAIEHYLHLASQQGWLTATVLRFSNVYGSILPPERRQGLIGVSISRILEGRKIQIFGSEETVRDYVHVDDVIRAIIQGLFQTEHFQIFNIGAGVGHSVREVLEILERVTEHPVLKEASDFGKNSFRLTPRVVLSIEKARRELGWEPKVSLEEGITTLWKSSVPPHGK